MLTVAKLGGILYKLQNIMDLPQFTFEIDDLYKSLVSDAFFTLEELKRRHANGWFFERMTDTAERFAPGHPGRVGEVKKQNFCLGTLVAYEALCDTPLDGEVRQLIDVAIGRQTLFLATGSQPPDVVYKDLAIRSRTGFDTQPELAASGDVIERHFFERCGEIGLATASWVGLGFAGQLIGAAHRSVLSHPSTTAIDRMCADAVIGLEEEWALFTAYLGNPPT